MTGAATRSAFPESEAEERLCPFGRQFEPPLSHCVGESCAAWKHLTITERKSGPYKGEPIAVGRCAR